MHAISALLARSFLSTQALSKVLQKRDAPLVTVDIPLTVNKDQRYVAGVKVPRDHAVRRGSPVLQYIIYFLRVIARPVNASEGNASYLNPYNISSFVRSDLICL